MSQSYFKSYNEVIDFIYRQLPIYQRQGPKALKYDLSNINSFMDALGHPQERFKSIHIAGTNGKGSTAHLIAAGFQGNAFKTGLYTSPHYVDYRERIKINGNFISKSAVLDFFNKHIGLIKELKPSYFELSVAMAFSFFAEQQVDIAVIEVGLGGRLDSTNVITPLLSVITNISLDHTQTLGNTLEEIATEKAGIIKNKVPVVIGDRHSKTKDVFERIAAKKKAPIYFTDDFQGETGYPETLDPLDGPFWNLNARYAFASLSSFCHHYPDFGLKLDKAISAFKKVNQLTNFIGRWQILDRDPIVIADGAHNIDGWKHSLKQLNQIKFNKLLLVIGFVFDKSYASILEMLPRDARYFFCAADIPRALAPNILRDEAKKLGLQGESFSSVNKALQKAKESASKEDLILVSGSIFIVGEIL